MSNILMFIKELFTAKQREIISMHQATYKVKITSSNHTFNSTMRNLL